MISVAERKAISEIAIRAVRIYESAGMLPYRSAAVARIMIADEIEIVHERLVTLRLDELLAADDFNLIHDVGGIHRHLDIGTRKRRPSLGCFLPRFARLSEKV